METTNIQTTNYNAQSEQRFPFTIIEDGGKYDTAHIYKPLNGERYIQFLNEINISGNDEKQTENSQAVQVALWKDLIKEIEDIEVEDGADFRELADTENEIIPSITTFLAVAVIEAEKSSGNKRRMSQKSEITVTTEAFYNGLPVRQTHKLKAKSLEFSKKFSRIRNNRFKPKKSAGVQNKLEYIYVPQDVAFGELYDEMFISQTGFENDDIPLRFKMAAIGYVFASTLNEKKS